jgi:hypothetical protein
MSDELYLLFFLASATALVSLPRPAAAVGAGVFAGLAFLTRPEGGVLCIGAAVGLAALLSWRRRSDAAGDTSRPVIGIRRLALAAVLFGGAFFACVTPYWLWIGGLSPKVNKETIDRFQPAESSAPRDAYARLLRRDYSWYGALGEAAAESVRAGRVVVPLIGLIALWRLRPCWRHPALAVLLACMCVHFGLITLLPYRHGYLHARHTLVVIALLTPIVGIALAFLVQQTRSHGQSLVGYALVAAALLGPAPWALRIPNHQDAFVARAAATLQQRDAGLAGKRLLSGSSGRPLAFYTGMVLEPWGENEPTEDARFAALRGCFVVPHPPDYFAIETGPTEREGNDRLIARLLGDPALASRLREVLREPGEELVVLRVFAID